MKNELISIIIPVYKVEKYLDKCVESVVSQTYKNLEIILVDDGSPDCCPEMCDKWAKKDGRIKVIHKKNGGLSDARNAGLDIMTGDYVMFVDSDDFIDSEMCDNMLSLMHKHCADICCCDYFEFKEGKPFKKEESRKNKVQCFNGEDVIDLLFNKKIPLIMVAWCKIYKVGVFDNLRFTVGKYHEDEYIIHHSLSKAKTVVYTKANYYNYLKRTGSITSKISNKNIEDSLEAFSQRYEFLNKNYEPKKEFIKLHYMGLLRSLCVICNDKALETKIYAQFRSTYKDASIKDKKDKIFNFMPRTYLMLMRMCKRLFW